MLLALLALQDLAELLERADRAFRPFEAAVRLERRPARADVIATAVGRMELTEERELTLRVRGERAEDLPGLEVWRRPWAELRRDHELIEERPGEPDGAVRGVDGEPLVPVAVRLRKGPAVALSEERGLREFTLAPRSGGVRLKVWFDEASLRAERVAWESRSGAVAVTLGDGGGPRGGPLKRGVETEERR
jgi:hypothetical protein